MSRDVVNRSLPRPGRRRRTPMVSRLPDSRDRRGSDRAASVRSFVIGGVIAVAMLWPSQAVAPVAASGGCEGSAWSRHVPPKTIRVWVPHRHTIWKPTFREYILRVMSAGAAPAYLPDASLRVMALAIQQYAWYEALHPSEDKRKRAGCYDIKNGGSEGQYVWPYSGLRPYTKRQEAAVDEVLGYTLWKPRDGGVWWFPRIGWRDGYGGRCGSHIDRWHIPEDEVTACANAGWGWKRIIRAYLSPIRLEEPR